MGLIELGALIGLIAGLLGYWAHGVSIFLAAVAIALLIHHSREKDDEPS